MVMSRTLVRGTRSSYTACSSWTERVGEGGRKRDKEKKGRKKRDGEEMEKGR
jgi:hypothetical protein